MCDQHCSVCDKGFSETCSLLTCPANSPGIVLRAVSPVEALQRYVKQVDRNAFDTNRFPTMAEWSAVVEMVGALELPEAAPTMLALPAPASRKTEGNVVAFKPRAR